MQFQVSKVTILVNQGHSTRTRDVNTRTRLVVQEHHGAPLLNWFRFGARCAN